MLVPTYEPSARYLRETLESVLQQDPGPAEMHLEVVDDGSTQTDVPALVRAIAGDRVSVSRNPRNLGLAGCWNACVQRATGTWIHLLHQDDVVFPGFYAELRETVRQFPEAGAAFCRHCFLDADSAWTGLSAVEDHQRTVLADWQFRLTTGQRIQCPSIVVQRATYETVGAFRSDLPYCLDWEMWTRIAAARPFAFSPRILAGYRNHAKSETVRLGASGRRLADQLKAFELLVDRLPPERRAAARQAFGRYLVPWSGGDANQEQQMAVVRRGLAEQIAGGSLPVKWYLTVPVIALAAKLRRRFAARTDSPHER
ncbi:MAG TPA: glycosyltransferase [Lacunisphaera sp.]|nr:glycosyltransferase [Lacunisphaera sp.]